MGNLARPQQPTAFVPPQQGVKGGSPQQPQQQLAQRLAQPRPQLPQQPQQRTPEMMARMQQWQASPAGQQWQQRQGPQAQQAPQTVMNAPMMRGGVAGPPPASNGFSAGGYQSLEQRQAQYDAEQARRAAAGIPGLAYGPPTSGGTTQGEGSLMGGSPMPQTAIGAPQQQQQAQQAPQQQLAQALGRLRPSIGAK